MVSILHLLKNQKKKKQQHQLLINKLTKAKKNTHTHTHTQTKHANRRARIHTLLVKDDGFCMCDGQLKGNEQGNLQKHKT
jgi:hypothetical protein